MYFITFKRCDLCGYDLALLYIHLKTVQINIMNLLFSKSSQLTKKKDGVLLNFVFNPDIL